jgi:hypothetical protein
LAFIIIFFLLNIFSTKNLPMKCFYGLHERKKVKVKI